MDIYKEYDRNGKDRLRFAWSNLAGIAKWVGNGCSLYGAEQVRKMGTKVECPIIGDAVDIPCRVVTRGNTCSRTFRPCIGGAWDGDDDLGIDCSSSNPETCEWRE